MMEFAAPTGADLANRRLQYLLGGYIALFNMTRELGRTPEQTGNLYFELNDRKGFYDRYLSRFGANNPGALAEEAFQSWCALHEHCEGREEDGGFVIEGSPPFLLWMDPQLALCGLTVDEARRFFLTVAGRVGSRLGVDYRMTLGPEVDRLVIRPLAE